MNPIFTIGHSRHEMPDFIGLLRRHDVAAVYDVRSRPYSRFQPQFNREDMARSLRDSGVGYVYLGDALGGRPDDPGCYVDGRVCYRRQARTPLFQAGLARLRHDAVRLRFALMCAEKDPLCCHRALSVAANLTDMALFHILADGTAVPHDVLIGRGMPEQGQFFFRA